MIGTIGLALLAGVLSTLSPCVLPLLPVVLGAAASEHRLGPAALAAGLALSFTVIGLFVAGLGYAAGLDAGPFRMAGAMLLIGIGLVLMVPALQGRLAGAAGFRCSIGQDLGLQPIEPGRRPSVDDAHVRRTLVRGGVQRRRLAGRPLLQRGSLPPRAARARRRRCA